MLLGDRVTYLASKLKGEEWAKKEFGSSNWRTARLKGTVVNVVSSQGKVKVKFDHVSKNAGTSFLSIYLRLDRHHHTHIRKYSSVSDERS